MPRVTLVRDSLVAAAVVSVWALEARAASAGQPGIALSVAAGLSAVVLAFLVHEWGHLAGALALGSRVFYPNRIAAPLLFHFDVGQNDRRQFLWMSYGGYLGSALGLIAIVTLSPLERLSGQVALGLAAMGVLVTLVAEVPTTVRVLRGGPLPSGYAFERPRG